MLMSRLRFATAVRDAITGRTEDCSLADPLWGCPTVLAAVGAAIGLTCALFGLVPPIGWIYATAGGPAVGMTLAGLIVGIVVSIPAGHLFDRCHAHCELCGHCSVHAGVPAVRRRAATDVDTDLCPTCKTLQEDHQ